jgi:hypothetical protein
VTLFRFEPHRVEIQQEAAPQRIIARTPSRGRLPSHQVAGILVRAAMRISRRRKLPSFIARLRRLPVASQALKRRSHLLIREAGDLFVRVFREKLLEKFDPLIVMAETTCRDRSIEKHWGVPAGLFQRAAKIEQATAVVKPPQLSAISAHETRAA